MTIQHRVPHSGRTVRHGEPPAVPATGTHRGWRDAWKALQARKPAVYGADTRNPRWRLRPQ